jgi:predicted ribonuclease YlaK
MGKHRHLNTENETPEVVRKIGGRKSMHPNDLKPFRALSKGHEDFLHLFYQQTPFISLHGFPGTGKTFIAMAAALSEVFDSSTPYEKLTIVRSAVEVRGIGFLPGTAEEKLEVYEQPYKSILKELMVFNDPYEMAKQLGYIEFVPTSFLRGTTFHNQIVLVDECENLDYKELETVATRAGDNCKMIFVGDDDQSDLFRQRQQSGFGDFRKVINNMDEKYRGMVEFSIDEIVRSKLVAEFLRAKSRTSK